MENGNKPAYPTLIQSQNVSTQWWDTINGLTKREEFVRSAMQGLLSNPEIMNHTVGFPSVEDVIKYADALLKALEPKTE